ncbi:M56 family metallopeptidase [Dactylosporangium fulvum]|uniref:M56 family metallopeptidase n=1 Tax=Dactylosporangium fulvum TaxID=53359 RepID=A0ABY5WCL0_9ACTN|nr:M56 family metallopeptidase [Dactylosporangium fulvum]UWP87021.1 M56 family metallopeptidase [Dactylosporangium fulvum]
MTAVLLGALGLTLSLVVPGPLARARWTARAPVAAIVLWQAVTLAAVLCALGVVLAGPEELVRAVGAGAHLAVAALAGALAVAVVVVLRLLVSLAQVAYRSRVRRARHRLLADLLHRAEEHGTFDEDVPPGALRVLDGNVPFAYCLPGRSPRIVLSQGTLRVLTTPQVAAVLAHERAHLRARHDVVMESFTAFYRAVPGPLRSRAPLDAVHLLLEACADDAARRRHGTAALRDALLALGGSTDALMADVDPDGQGRDAERERRWRLDRLAPGVPGSDPLLSVAVCALAAAILVLPTVVLVVPWLDRALRTWPL